MPAAAPDAPHHIGDCGTMQRKKRSARGKALPDQAMSPSPTQSLSEKAEQPDPKFAGEPVRTLEKNKQEQDAALASPKIKRGVNSAAEPKAASMMADSHHQQKKRTSRSRKQPDVLILDADPSDAEQEQEDESDADFVAPIKGSKKVRFLV